MPARPRSRQRKERGQTIFIVAVALVVALGMAAFAIDVTYFYIARSQAQKAADAAALAGAKAFVSSGFTSWQLGDPASGTAQALACNGGSGFADTQARAASNQNLIAGVVATTLTTTCSFANPANPQITVALTRTNLPIFFGRIWGRRGIPVSATARAEAYNPSGENVPIEVASVKPWLVTNCDLPPTANCHFLDPTNNYQIVQTPLLVGQTIRLQQFQLDGSGNPVALAPGVLSTFYPLNIPVTAATASCPSGVAPSCSGVDAGAPGFFETVACANSVRLQCGLAAPQGVTGYTLASPPTDQAALCLVHADGLGLDQGQDIFSSPGGGLPENVEGGYNNTNTALRGVLNISRSDSVITVPLWDGSLNPACQLGISPACVFNIVGFMQLGITQITKPFVGPLQVVVIEGVVLNLSGCGGVAAGTPVSGGAISPVPVRLVQ